jgi:hypothetical protein
MKSIGFYLLNIALLTLMVACGKDNESGKKSSYNYNNPLCQPGYSCQGNYYNSGQIGAINSPIAFANQAQAENPCAAGTYYTNQRIAIQTTISVMGLIPNDVYLGVTSYGDVAVLVGNGQNTATLYAYVCPRFSTSGQGQITPPKVGAVSGASCQVKPITDMTMLFPDGQRAAFRDPAFGIINPMTGQKVGKFSFCFQ